MSLKESLETIVGAEKASTIMNIITRPQRKYVATDKGREARKRANLKYRTKANATDPQVVKEHLKKYKEEKKCDHEILTNLWKHYCDDVETKIRLTRKQYLTLLEQAKIAKQNPHIRNGQKYYADGYDLTF